MPRTRVVVDPITRIEGHLRIEVQSEAGKIEKAWASSTQFRGIETIMQGRDPRDAWAFTQRICGVCTVVHAVASCRAVEDALDITIPQNANLIRNLIHGMQFVQDHVIHFYHLHALDWVDVVSALSADPAATSRLAQSLSPWPNNSATYFAEVQNRVKEFVGSGQLGIFSNGYWGHPAYKLPPAANLMAVAHYLEALDWQRDVIRLHTIFGGKNPHPNFLVGGMASAINLDDTATINTVRLTEVKDLITRAQRFVEQVYWPDLLAVAGFYKDWAAIGGGTGNYLACGEFPDRDVRDISSLYFPRGIIMAKDLTKVLPYDHMKVQEYITSSWYEYAGGDKEGLHPWKGETKAKYSGPPTPWTYLQDEKKYTWMKAPRYDGHAMEVGPLARMLVGFASGHHDIREIVGEVLNRLNVGPAALFSTLGRTAARGIETVLLARRLSHWYDELVARIKGGDVATFNKSKWDPSTWPATAQGYGYLDAPRGALGHWVEIEHGKISRYQCVVPSTWNCSPRDEQGQPGPYEAALMDHHPLVDPKRPIEILRTIHSFDPCMACGVHVLDAQGGLVTEVKSAMNKRSYAVHSHEGPMLTGRPDHKWVYLWHWPIRAMHWIAAFCIAALVVTGFYIGKPYFMTGGEGTPRFAMGWMRFIHFAAAGVLVATAIVRTYWLLMGNKFERWTALFPVRRRDWINMYRTMKFYLMIKPEEAPHYLGHNPMQQMSYTGMYVLAAIQVMTGFAMYGLASPGSTLAHAFGWINPLMGGEQIVRFTHHVVTWAFIAFVPIHVYLALRADLIERSGTISSIVSGGRFVPAGLHYEDE